jgi:tocopherol O-methyltransferase
MTIRTNDITDYYNQTLNHYQQHWNLNHSKALHYGLWYHNTKNLSEALENTNQKIAELGDVQKKHTLLDAGCGIGGTAMYLASNFHCKVNGITLSEKQLLVGNKHILAKGLDPFVQLEIMNFELTKFSDNSFDLVYGIESICHSTNKEKFLQEAYRLLRPGGKLIVIDFFQDKKILTNKEAQIMTNWLDRWAVSNLTFTHTLIEQAEKTGFHLNLKENLSTQIIPSAKKLYQASILGLIPSKLYAIYNRNVTRYAKQHYKSGIYQYKALKKGLWNYSAICLEKQ